jgi:hypothetical protein
MFREMEEKNWRKVDLLKKMKYEKYYKKDREVGENTSTTWTIDTTKQNQRLAAYTDKPDMSCIEIFIWILLFIMNVF